MTYRAAITTLVAVLFVASAMMLRHEPVRSEAASIGLAPLAMTISENLPTGFADTSF